jgi:PKD repeat protein
VLNVTPTSGTAPLVVNIDSSASQGGGSSTITGRTIDFGDGTSVNSTATTTHTYTNPGSYTVKLTLTNQAGQTATANSVVTVTAAPAPVAPVPVLNVTPTSGTAPLVVNIDASASQGGGGSTITGRTINFGDGTWLSWTPTTTHTYTKAGSYTVVLSLKNQAGLTATATSVVTVN